MAADARLTIAAQVSQVPVAASWLSDQCQQCGIPPARQMNLDLCLDEVLMNVLTHSGASQGTAPIELSFQCHGDGSRRQATVTVVDCGMPFNPLTVTPKALPSHLDEATLGGLGLRILRQNAEQLAYQFQDGQNQLTFGVSWEAVVAANPAA